jgi:hypothetical protein
MTRACSFCEVTSVRITQLKSETESCTFKLVIVAKEMIGMPILGTEHVDGIVEVFDAGQLLQPRLDLLDEEVLESLDAWSVIVELQLIISLKTL